jgi:Holliday junction resolvasome RuvABC endonuclease subunit
MIGCILAIDPATHCGWALRCPDGSIVSGVWSLKQSRYEGGGMRWLRMRGFLEEIGRTSQPELVAYEEVRNHKGVDAAHIYGGIVSVLQEWAEKKGIPYTALPVATVKRTATGKGNADKDAMVAAAKQRWPQFLVEDDNQADALWILETAVRQHCPVRAAREPVQQSMLPDVAF